MARWSGRLSAIAATKVWRRRRPWLGYAALRLFAGGGYQGPQFAQAITSVFPELDVEIVKRTDAAGRFKVLPRRWATLPKVPRA
jgi:hypothetical protein